MLPCVVKLVVPTTARIVLFPVFHFFYFRYKLCPPAISLAGTLTCRVSVRVDMRVSRVGAGNSDVRGSGDLGLSASCAVSDTENEQYDDDDSVDYHKFFHDFPLALSSK
jgi:hypothetical protein